MLRRITKRSIIELKEAREKKESTDERHILGFKDSKKVGGVPKEVSPLVITTKIANFKVSGILIDGVKGHIIALRRH